LARPILQTVVDQLNETNVRIRDIEARLAKWHRASPDVAGQLELLSQRLNRPSLRVKGVWLNKQWLARGNAATGTTT
jgi:hypothetical protein